MWIAGEANTEKHRTHSMFKQNIMFGSWMPALPECYFGPLMQHFNRMIIEHYMSDLVLETHTFQIFKGMAEMGDASSAALLLPTHSLMLGFTTLFGIILGFTLLTPAMTLLLSRVLRDCLAGAASMLGALSAWALLMSLSHTGMAVAALMVAIMATMGVRVMVDYFWASMVDWLSRTLCAVSCNVLLARPALIFSK